MLWLWLYNPRAGLFNALLAKIGIEGPRWIYSTEWAMPSLIIMGLWTAGGAMLIFLAGLQGIPTALYESAKIDGANAWHRFWSITLPLLTPTILFSVIMRVIGSWQVFTQAYVMTAGGPNNATLTMVLLLYRKAFQQFNFGYASSLAWLLFGIILLLTLLTFRSSQMWVFYESEVK
jgi:multiple sugar transport system permease protein